MSLTGSAFWVGSIGFANGIPLLLMSPMTGILADRARKQTILAIAMVMAFASSVGLALLIASGRTLAWQVVLTSFLVGSAFSLFAPARSAMLARLVPAEILLNASIVQYSSTRIVAFLGPALAGAILGAFGVVPALVSQSVLFIVAAAIYSTTPVVESDPAREMRTSSPYRGLKDGAKYVGARPVLRDMVLLGLVVVPFGMTYGNLLPVLARNVLGVGAPTLGLMVGVVYLGTALVGFWLVGIETPIRTGPALLGSAFASGLGLVLLAFTRDTVLALSLLLLLGIVNGIFLSLTTALFQVIPEQHYRGRMMALWGMVWGLAPFANLAGGAAAENWGVRPVLVFDGLLCAAVAARMFVVNSDLRKME